MLVGVALFGGKCVFPEGGVYLHHTRPAWRNLPAVERPETHALTQLPAQVQQPRNPSMRGLGDRPLHVEVENRLGRTGPLFRQAPPAGIATTVSATAVQGAAEGLDRGIVCIGWPMTLEVTKERRPVRRQVVFLEVAPRKGKAVVDADQRRHLFAQPFRQPFGNTAPCPVLAGARWWQDFNGWRGSIRQIDTQAFLGWRWVSAHRSSRSRRIGRTRAC